MHPGAVKPPEKIKKETEREKEKRERKSVKALADWNSCSEGRRKSQNARGVEFHGRKKKKLPDAAASIPSSF